MADFAFTKQSPNASIEAAMLRDLGKQIAAPKVLTNDHNRLTMQKIPYSGVYDEKEFAKALARMHSRRQPYFGYPYDTTIGPFLQPNPKEHSWPTFFGKHRIAYMAKHCLDEGALAQSEYERLLQLSQKLHNYLPRAAPCLIHGDLWGGNVMHDSTQTVLIDPALYFGSYEYDIAFSRLFHTFSQTFYRAYEHYLPLDDDFYKNRVSIYNLYGLLVHLRAFGQMYHPPVVQTLEKFGY